MFGKGRWGKGKKKKRDYGLVGGKMFVFFIKNIFNR